MNAIPLNNIDTSDFVLKTKYHTDKTEIENKSSDVRNLVKKKELTESENKIPDINNLATKTALTTVEDNIPDITMIINVMLLYKIDYYKSN